MKNIIERVKSWLNRKPSYWYVSYLYLNGENKGCGFEYVKSPCRSFNFKEVRKNLMDKRSLSEVVILNFIKVDKSYFTSNNY